MYHEATACHVTGDLADLLSLILQVLKVARHILADRKSKFEATFYILIQTITEKSLYVFLNRATQRGQNAVSREY